MMVAERTVQVGSVWAALIGLELREQYSYLLEGSPSGVRSMMMDRFVRELARRPRGLHIDDARLERTAPANWLPRELVRATLRSTWVPENENPMGRTLLHVVWLQHADQDPFARLREIASPLDWAALSVYEPPED